MIKYIEIVAGLVLSVLCVVNAAEWWPVGLIGSLVGGAMLGKGIASWMLER